MHTRSRSSLVLIFSSLLVLGSLVLAGCGSAASGTGNSSSGGSNLTNVSIGLGYIPDIQFAPFYVAQSKGYYKAAGLNVTLHNGIVNDLIGSMVLGHDNFVFASGDEVMTARSKNLPVVDVSTIYQRYPVCIIVPANSPIKTLADLKGHTIGSPASFGATYIGMLALLYHAHLSLSDVHVETIGFTQVTALLTHKVDAVVGYSNNEALQLPAKGMPVRTFDVSDYQPLVSNGIVVTEDTLHNEPQMVKSFVQATLKGVQYVINNPKQAVQISKAYVPGMDVNEATQVLMATIPVLKGNGHLGYNDSATWQSMVQFLVADKIIPPVQDITQAYTNVGIS
ncbi:MAG TPA: ABC transporter substrate-binding protein [Ktedonobacteraceae bacterium]|nr:ABC transporter substrate-binding protein [Ktedonobacteraceae bacterium]